MLKLKLQVLQPPDVKSLLVGKDPDAGKFESKWRRVEIEDEMVGWHHQLNGHEFQQAPGDSEGWEAWRAADHGVKKSQT